jgi:outer membrane protein OmpA-like peptidoglycan-associated protein
MKFFTTNPISLLFFCYLFTCQTIIAQEIQWAWRVLGVSSEYNTGTNRKPYSAKQLLAAPNVLPAHQNSPCAWQPRPQSNKEWVKVGYRNPQPVQQIIVAENSWAGTIENVFLYDTEGNEFEVFKDTVTTIYEDTCRIFTLTIPLTAYKVAALKLQLNLLKVKGVPQIDAIGISQEIHQQFSFIQLLPTEEKITIEALPESVNSPYNEILPMISADGNTLYFDRIDHPENTKGTWKNDDIWVSQLQNGTWQPATRLPAPLNNAKNNYVCAVLAEGKQLLLANDYAQSEQNAGGISISQRKNDSTWTFPEKVHIENYYNLSPYAEFHIATTQNVLLMAIEREDSEGGRDLYVSFLKSDKKTWTSPKNLGSVLNTAGTELSPFLAYDNTTLYFASNGFSGYGSVDVYMTKRLDNTWTNWTTPVNLGQPFNTKDWDASYTLDAQGEYAYFAAFQGAKDSNIFRAKLPTPLRPSKPVVAKNVQEELGFTSLEKGKTFRLNHIIFEQGTTELLDTSFKELDNLVVLLQENPSMEIELRGHTDIDGSPIDNMKLSKERVKLIKDYLTKKGVPSQRIHTRAFGSQQPLTRQRDENSKQLNRRVELRIVK